MADSKLLKSGKEGFPLMYFALTYVGTAIKVAEKKPTLSEFERELFSKISYRFNMDNDSIRYLENPFYWELFCNGKSLELVESGIDNNRYRSIFNNRKDGVKVATAFAQFYRDSNKVVLRDENVDVIKRSKNIVESNRAYFEARLERLERLSNGKLYK